MNADCIHYATETPSVKVDDREKTGENYYTLIQETKTAES